MVWQVEVVALAIQLVEQDLASPPCASTDVKNYGFDGDWPTR